MEWECSWVWETGWCQRRWSRAGQDQGQQVPAGRQWEEEGEAGNWTQVPGSASEAGHLWVAVEVHRQPQL